ncbi:MAG: helix-turn-helix domain-containing protein [Victivallales bacterium]|jgi:excisionase family DNA binding protein
MKINKMPINVLMPVHSLLQPYCPALTPETLIEAIEKYVSGATQPVKTEKLYSQNEACSLFGFSRPTLLKLRKEGKIHGIKAGDRKIIISHSEIEQFMKDNSETIKP